MATTVANQKTIIINKHKVDKDFLQIGREDLYTASKELSGAEFKLYIYLAANANGYRLVLSQAAFIEAMGVSRSSYYDALTALEKKGYLVHESSNTYHFYEKPRAVRKSDSGDSKPAPKTGLDNPKIGQESPKKGQGSPEIGRDSPKSDIEIDKINNINKTDRIDMPPIVNNESENTDLNARFLTDIKFYINLLKQTETLKDGHKKITRLITDGKRSAEWVYTALNAKSHDNWNDYGFGLILGTSAPCLSFQKQIDDKVNAIVAERKRIGEQAKLYSIKEPQKIVVVQPRPKRLIKQPIDLSSII